MYLFHKRTSFRQLIHCPFHWSINIHCTFVHCSSTNDQTGNVDKKKSMKIKYILAICLFTSLSISLFAQDEEEPKKGFDKSKLFISGNFGLSFGDFTLVNVSPQIG